MSISDAQFEDWLADLTANRVLLIHLHYAGGIEYLATSPYVSGPTDTIANQPYNDIVKKAVDISTRIDDQTSFGEIDLLGDGDTIDWEDRAWEGHPIEVYLGAPDWSRDDFRLWARGRNGGITDSRRGSLVFEMESEEQLLDTTIDTGTLAIDGGPVPLALGSVYNAPLSRISTSTYTYKVSYLAITSANVKDNGQPVSHTTDTANGEVTLSNRRVGELSVDIEESHNTPTSIVNWVAGEYGLTVAEVDLPSYTVGLYYDSEVTGQQILDDLCDGIGAYWYINALQELVVKQPRIVRVFEDTPAQPFFRADQGDTGAVSALPDRTGNATFAFLNVEVPASPQGVLFEVGGTGSGFGISFDGAGQLVAAAGDGSTTSTDTGSVFVTLSDTSMVGKFIDIYVSIRPTAPGQLSVYAYERGTDTIVAYGTAQTTDGTALQSELWAGTGSWGVGTVNSAIRDGLDATDFNGTMHLGTMAWESYLPSDFGQASPATASQFADVVLFEDDIEWDAITLSETRTPWASLLLHWKRNFKTLTTIAGAIEDSDPEEAARLGREWSEVKLSQDVSDFPLADDQTLDSPLQDSTDATVETGRRLLMRSVRRDVWAITAFLPPVEVGQIIAVGHPTFEGRAGRIIGVSRSPTRGITSLDILL